MKLDFGDSSICTFDCAELDDEITELAHIVKHIVPQFEQFERNPKRLTDKDKSILALVARGLELCHATLALVSAKSWTALPLIARSLLELYANIVCLRIMQGFLTVLEHDFYLTQYQIDTKLKAPLNRTESETQEQRLRDIAARYAKECGRDLKNGWRRALVTVASRIATLDEKRPFPANSNAATWSALYTNLCRPSHNNFRDVVARNLIGGQILVLASHDSAEVSQWIQIARIVAKKMKQELESLAPADSATAAT